MLDINTMYLNRRKEVIRCVHLDKERLNLRPEDWQLYSGGKKVADKINRAIAQHYNSGARGVQLMALCHGTLDKFSEH